MASSLAALASCGDLPRTNPYDPSATVQLVLLGPDSVTAIGDTVKFEVRAATGESLDQLAAISVPPFLSPTGPRGQFVAIGVPSLARANGTITARVSANEVSKPFVFSQQPARLSVTDCQGHRAITFTSLLASFNPTFDDEPVCAWPLDRRGNVIPGTSAGAGIIRDPRVARFVDANQSEVNAVSVGTTYAVYSRAGLTDSIRIDVRQDPASFSVDPPECGTRTGVVLAPNEIAQLTARGPVNDAHGNPVVDPSVVQAAFASLQWTNESNLNVRVSSTGTVLALSRSSGYVRAELGEGEERRPVLYCYVVVR